MEGAHPMTYILYALSAIGVLFLAGMAWCAFVIWRESRHLRDDDK
jgi:hypothetical protein